MIVHPFTTHPRDAWCFDFHLGTYLEFCDVAVVAVDSAPDYSQKLRRHYDDRLLVIDFDGRAGIPDSRVNQLGVFYQERQIKQAAMDEAMQLEPSLIFFGDTDEVPTPDVIEWAKFISEFPQRSLRWYAHWVNLWQDFQHAIGGDSVWSFQSGRGNKKCIAMQPCADMAYVGGQHCGMEPGRFGGGSAPTGEGHHLIDSPKLLHLKYGSRGYADRPEAKLKRHAPEVMLEGGRVVDVPEIWLWPEMLAL